MAVSTNLGLYLPTREDYISVSRDLSNNYEIIDKSAGMLEKGIAIVVDGDTAPLAISSGDYLFIKNHSSLATGGYHATANIANGAAVNSSNTAADSKGVTNAIKANIDSLNSKITDVTSFGTDTLAHIESAIVAGLGNLSVGVPLKILFIVSAETGIFKNTSYTGTLTKTGNDGRCYVEVYGNYGTQKIIGKYQDSWTWEEIAFDSDVNVLRSTFSVSGNSSTTVTLKGNALLITGHNSTTANRGLYFVSPSILSPLIEATNLTLSLSSGVLSITNSGSSTASCLLLFNVA